MTNEYLISLFREIKEKRGCTIKFISDEAKIEYQRALTIFSSENRKPLYDLLVYMMAANWYDNRGVQAIGTEVTDLSLSVNSLILQLRNEVPDNDT